MSTGFDLCFSDFEAKFVFMGVGETIGPKECTGFGFLNWTEFSLWAFKKWFSRLGLVWWA